MIVRGTSSINEYIVEVNIHDYRADNQGVSNWPWDRVQVVSSVEGDGVVSFCFLLDS
jgi:hypothetical protein